MDLAGKKILVTGGNKGIGFALVKRILHDFPDTFVLLGSRDIGRGEVAVREIKEENSEIGNRIQAIQIDTSNDFSVEQAAASVLSQFGAHSLYGIVNNAGIYSGDVREVNILGPRRVFTAFLPLLATEGRVVNISSASGPNFVSKCAAERQAFLCDNAAITWEEILGLVSLFESLRGDGGEAGVAALASNGFGTDLYGFSKACLNAYTQMLARDFPQLRVNACTPGFIETDLTRGFATQSGKTPAEMGMKSPKEGTHSAIFLLFGEPPGNGFFFGSDCLRSPLDRYRAPGTPEFTGK